MFEIRQKKFDFNNMNTTSKRISSQCGKAQKVTALFCTKRFMYTDIAFNSTFLCIRIAMQKWSPIPQCRSHLFGVKFKTV